MTQNQIVFLYIQVANIAGIAISNISVKIFIEREEITSSLSIKESIGLCEISGLEALKNYEIKVSSVGYDEDTRHTLLISGINKQTFFLGLSGSEYYFVGGIRMPFVRHEEAVVILHTHQSRKTISRETKIDHLVVECNALPHPKLNNIKSGVISGILIKNTTLNPLGNWQQNLCEAIESDSTVGKPGIILYQEGDRVVCFANEIEVQFRSRKTENSINQFLNDYGLILVFSEGNRFVFKATVFNYNLIQLCNNIYDNEDDVLYAEIIVYSTTELDEIIPNDYLFPGQWDHNIIQTPKAWDYLSLHPNINTANQFGNKNIIIGVNDGTGIQSNHPDLSGNLSDNATPKVFAKYDFKNLVANMGNITGTHGTCCAGAATAQANKLSISNTAFAQGTVGIAGNCQLVCGLDGGTDDLTRELLEWFCGFRSPNAGLLSKLVDVSSMSFGREGSISSVMRWALDLATDFGRQGRGLSMLFSSNNLNTQMFGLRPWAAYNRTIAITSSSLYNNATIEAKAVYSGFGIEADVCTPSSSSLIENTVHNPPLTYGAFTTTITNAIATLLGFADGNLPGFPALVAGVDLKDNLSVLAQAGTSTLFTINNVLPRFDDQSAILIDNPGSVNSEGVMITSLGPANRIDIRVNLNFLALQKQHGIGINIFGGAADYMNSFGGTSYSTPICAGIVALMLSVKPSLTWVEIREILRTTSRKINVSEAGIAGNVGRWFDGSTPLSNMVMNVAGTNFNFPYGPPPLLGGTFLTSPVIANSNADRSKNFTTNTLSVVSVAYFNVGDAVCISDNGNIEFRVIESIGANTITIDNLANSYPNPGLTSVDAGFYKPLFSQFYGYGRVNADHAVKGADLYNHAWRDLVIRNFVGDTGLVDIDPIVNPINSPDIWMRNQSDPVVPVPSYGKSGSHENPKTANDRFIYVRVKNIGNGGTNPNNLLTNLDAWVHFYVALTDETLPPITVGNQVNPAPGIKTPFLFPGNPTDMNTAIVSKSWCDIQANDITSGTGIITGNTNIYHVRDTIVPFIYNPQIQAGTLVPADPNNLETGTAVFRMKWNADDLPPVGTNMKVYLLAYVSPVDGLRQGRGAELNNNMSYREIAFADFNFKDGVGIDPLISSITVDNFGTQLNTPFRVQVLQTIGNFTTEKVTIEILRENDNGMVVKAEFKYTGTNWQLLDNNGIVGNITWAHMTPPLITANNNPAIGDQTDITFLGDFDSAKQHSKVTIRAIINSTRPGNIWVPIAEEDYEVSIVEQVQTAQGADPTSPPEFIPISFAFADMASLSQIQDHAYGPAFDSADPSSTTIPENRFRITNSFTASTDVNAYAVTDGDIMIQKVDNDRINLILRPRTQPILGFTPVKYFIYRGLRLADFLDITNFTKVTPSSSSNSEFITSLYQMRTSGNQTGDFLTVALGYNPNVQQPGDNIDKYFFRMDPDFQLPPVSKGMQLGKFFHTNNEQFGFEIVMEDELFIPTYDFARKRFFEINKTQVVYPPGATLDEKDFLDKIERDKILAFMDAAAFYGMHITPKGYVEVKIGNINVKKIEHAIFTDVVWYFYTKNRLYVDIRNEHNNSMNFYENYDGSAVVPISDPNKQIQIGDTSINLTPEEYKIRIGTNIYNWPIFVLDAPQSSNPNFNTVYLALRIDDNIKPLLFIEKGDKITASEKVSFVNDIELLPNTTTPPFTNVIGFKYPNTPGIVNMDNIASLIKLHYKRKIDPLTPWHTNNKTLKTEHFLDNLFASIDTEQIVTGSSSNSITWNHNYAKRFSDASAEGIAQIMERGIAIQPAPPSNDRAVFYACATDIQESPNIFTAQYGVGRGFCDLDSALKSDMLFGAYNVSKQTLNVNGHDIPVVFFQQNPDARFQIPVENSHVVGITCTQLNILKNVAGFTPNYPRFLAFQDLGTQPDDDGIMYKLLKVGVKGLQTDGQYLSFFPNSNDEILVRTPINSNSFLFTSNEYAVLEPPPSPLNLTYEEKQATKSKPQCDIAKTIMESDSAIKAIVNAFTGSLSAINGTGSAARKQLKTLVQDQSLALFNQAVTSNQSVQDDRPLYWARLIMIATLKERMNMIPDLISAGLVTIFDRRSRGYDSINFTTATKKILLLGFDPFYFNNNPNQSNPSGAAALFLHNNTLESTNAKVQSIIIPVRFADFDKGIIDKLIDPFLFGTNSKVSMILTMSQTDYELFKVERWAAKYRGQLPDNLNQSAGLPTYYVPINSALPGLTIADSTGKGLKEFLETKLPWQQMVPGTNANAELIFNQEWMGASDYEQQSPFSSTTPSLNTHIPPDNEISRSGSGSNFLSNEIFYRVALLRDMRTTPNNTFVKTGHLHIKRTQTTPNPAFNGSLLSQVVSKVKDIVKDALSGL